MRHTEQRGHAEDLGQICPETGEHEVGQENILLHFPGEVIDSAGVGQVEQGPSLGERGVCIVKSHGGRVLCEKGEG